MLKVISIAEEKGKKRKKEKKQTATKIQGN